MRGHSWGLGYHAALAGHRACEEGGYDPEDNTVRSEKNTKCSTDIGLLTIVLLGTGNTSFCADRFGVCCRDHGSNRQVPSV